MSDEINDLARARLERVADALQSEASVTTDPLRRVALYCASSNTRLRALWLLQKYDATEVHRALVCASAEAETMLAQGGPQ